ncbi:MAG: 1-phosphofructokinase family hexose kinase [Bacteroidota bacterium]
MVTTVTLNPMLDKTIYVDRLRHGEITRAAKREMVPGGKGINVARQLTRFSVESVATGFMGGEIGEMVERFLDEEGVRHDFVHIKDCTREGITIFETTTGISTGIFEPGHQVSHLESELLKEKCERLLEKSEWLVLSGSTPYGELDFFYKELIEKANRTRCRVVLDSYGNAFKLGVGAKPFMVKPNLKEFEQTFGVRLNSESAILEQLEWLETSGVSLAILTETEKPFYVRYLGRRWRVTPPAIHMVNPVGSGDAFVAGTIFGILQQWDLERTIRFATAAGAVNASRWAVVDVSVQEAEDLAPKVVLEAI